MIDSNNLAEVVLAAPHFSSARISELTGQGPASTELSTAAHELAAMLRNAGATPSEPVFLFISNKPQDLAGFLGLWLAGCVPVPVHITTPDPAVQTLTTRVGARFAIRAGKLDRIGFSSPPERPLLKGAALIVFTSGSTGQPKGVVVPHAGLIWKLEVLSRLLEVTAEDVVVVPLQLTFIFGIWVSLLALMSGSRLLLTSKLSSGDLKSLADVTVLSAVPTLLRSLCTATPVLAPRMRTILTGGEPFNPALAQQLTMTFPQAGIFDLFGLTETGSCDFCVRPNDPPDARGTIGRPTEDVSFRIAEAPKDGLPAGVGELQIHTPAVMLGYLDDPALTAAAFAGDYFRTGDLARVLENGCVQLVGRSKEIVSRGGNKIAPLEIENLFAQHEHVTAVLAFGMPDERLGESLHLMVVPGDPLLNEVDLRTWAKERLERFKIPDEIHFVEALPAGRTGKADRTAARRALLDSKAT
jgi:long-chain acyl-CoA synthetase